jgi:hypothetical protein
LKTLTGMIRNEIEIKEKIKMVEEKLASIEASTSKELAKGFFRRDYYIFQFLNIERKIYTRLLKELKWILNE